MMIFADPDIEYEIKLMPSHAPNNACDCYVIIEIRRAGSKERAKQAAEELSSLFNWGRETYWRVLPEGIEQKDFKHDAWLRGSYARFGFKLKAGDHALPAEAAAGVRYIDLIDIIPTPER